MQGYIHNFAEIISACICTICLLYKPSFFNRWFVLFLWCTSVIELIAKSLTFYNASLKAPLYSIFNGIEFIFYLFMLYKLNRKSSLKEITLLSLPVFILFFLINLFFFQGFKDYNNHTHSFGSILLVAMCLMQFFKISFSEVKVSPSIKWPLVCIVSALLFYYTVNFIHTALFNYTSKRNMEAASWLYRLINHNSNIILYSLLSIAFIIEAMKRRGQHFIAKDSSRKTNF